jgi:putative ABC transport system ATP-binding protein
VTWLVEARHVSRTFSMPAGPVSALNDVSLGIAAAEYIGIVGPSGCGKSTLLHVLGCVDEPTSGEVRFQDRPVGSLSDADRSRLRLREIGFVFQRFFLLPMLTAWENVELPQAEAGVARAERRARTGELLEYVGLAARAKHRPSELSGGEMQRVAIARALANRPRLLLADEPTGELDQATGDQIVGLLDRLHRDGTAVVVVTHDATVASRAQRLITMRDGRIVSDTDARGRATDMPIAGHDAGARVVAGAGNGPLVERAKDGPS